MAKKIDAVTRHWIRNASDGLAAENGCRFDESRGQFVIDWMAKYLRLYEGDWAGEPLVARDWQVEAIMRLFGWVKFSDRWNRKIRRFTKASIWVPKKNRKTPTAAAIALYLLCADGEMGQKVFLAAKDGAQVRKNLALHCIEMAKASPELMAECHINHNEMQISHQPTRSIMLPLSSSNARTQKAKEGINGSIIVDETHVVDRAMMSRITRAGISRSEPLRVEVSTAGDDPQSYGKSQYDYGKQVESGQREDEQFFFLAYEAPQSLSDADLKADPVKYGRLANPAWGHTVGEEEFLGDMNQSSVSLSDWADFKMYRLNIWQSASNPAIRPEDWAECRDDFTEQDLLGHPCYSSLDLGFKHDSSALVHLFPWEVVDEYRIYRLLVRFWLPRDAAHAERKDTAWLDWEKSGHIKLVDGNQTDFPLIKRTILEDNQKFRILQLGYDERFASTMCQELQDEHAMIVMPFTQNATSYNEACLTFETDVIERRIRHQGNPCMAWQTSVITFIDKGGLKMPGKPKNNAMARIDGPVAAIMARGLAMAGESSVSCYETRDLLIL